MLQVEALNYRVCCCSCRLSSAAYAAIACLAVEFLGLFMGVSLFLKAHNCVYIMMHFAGAIVTALMYTQVRRGFQGGCRALDAAV